MDDDEIVQVVGDRYCVPYTMELTVKSKMQSFSNVHYDVFDATGNILLQIDGGVWNFHRKRVMKDPAGFTVITMREKALSWKQQWVIHEGESSENKTLFSVHRSNALWIKNKLDVYLPSSCKSSDFGVTGNFGTLSFKVGRQNSIIAEVKHNLTWGSCRGKESFKVKVYPGVDYAFIVALLVIMHTNDTA